MEPADALTMLNAGASFVQLHSGLVYTGPGLPKRINEAILQTARSENMHRSGGEPARYQTGTGWIPAFLLSAGMMLGGVLAWLVAVTSVILPYDEAFLGMSREEILQINERLLLFMSHDRISLAGTMISIGVVYFMLAVFGSGCFSFRSIFWPYAAKPTDRWKPCRHSSTMTGTGNLHCGGSSVLSSSGLA